MRLSLEFNETQAQAFQEVLDVALRSLVGQEAMLKDALDDKTISEADFHAVNNYMSKITVQRLIVAETLGSIMDAEKQTKIITHLPRK